jgi:hypothetical protein
MERIEENNELTSEIKEFLDKLNEIYNDISKRISLESWQELMDMPIVREEETSLVVEEELFRYLYEHRYLPPEVWNLIETNYHWTDKEDELCDRHDGYIIDDILDIIENPNKPNYRFISNIDENYLEQYLSLREEAFENYYDEEYTDAFNLINKAYRIYSKDPELLEIYGYIMMENSVFELALSYLKEALEIDRKKLLCAFKIGIILNLMGKYNEAIPYLESYLNEAHNKEIKDQMCALYNLGYAFYYNVNYDMAKNYFYEALSLGEVDKEIEKLTRAYLQNIDSKLQGKTIRKIKPNRIKIKESVDSKKIVSKEQKKRNATIRKNRWKSIISVIVFMSLLYSYKFYSKNFFNKKNTNQMDKEMKNEIDKIMNDPNTKQVEYPDEKVKKTVGTIEDFQQNKQYGTYSFYLNNIIPCDLYAIIDDDGGLRLYSQEAITANNLSKEIVARFYVGNINGQNIMFVEKNFTIELVDKDGGYTVSGNRCVVNMDEPVNIPMQNGDYITINKYFISNIKK